MLLSILALSCEVLRLSGSERAASVFRGVSHCNVSVWDCQNLMLCTRVCSAVGPTEWVGEVLDVVNGRHCVLYEDGEHELLALSEERLRYLGPARGRQLAPGYPPGVLNHDAHGRLPEIPSPPPLFLVGGCIFFCF